MHTRRCFMLLSGLAAVLWLSAVPAMAQNPPAPLGADLMNQVQLNQTQIDQICAYIQYWAGRLNAAASAPQDVERARDELVRPFNQPGSARTITPDFRGTFSRCVVPEMDKALAGQDIYRAINAALVLAQVGSDKAANSLLLNADVQHQPAFQVRMQSANGMRILLIGGTLDGRKVIDAAKKLRDAIGREDDGRVLRHQFGALAAADSTSLQPNDRSAVRAIIAESVATAAKRAANAQTVSGPTVAALATAVVSLRNRFDTEFTAQERMTLGATLGPALGALLAWSGQHWDAVQNDPALSRDIGILVASCETLLQRIDPVMASGANRATPASDMNSAWRTGDKPKFEAGVKAWQDVLGKAPYKSS